MQLQVVPLQVYFKLYARYCLPFLLAKQRASRFTIYFLIEA